ncbi:MAG: bifunctional diaminohydroxyphosphoribosylaminopyrimidine deaminase/5-amino-6-(5-phosphoribosylamino)uracil reductase RibD [Sphingomonadaceae bacterium]
MAASLAGRGRPLSHPNPAVGCVLVRDGRIVGRGWTQKGGRPHAEAMALDQAGEQARGAAAYVTLEPCAHASPRGPCCADLLIRAGIASVIIGVTDPDPRTSGKSIARLREAGIDVSVLECRASRRSLEGYLMRSHSGRPHITLKLATSMDGCIAQADGCSQWITGPIARNHCHLRRSQSDAILVGGATWRIDQPKLNVRLPGIEQRSPQRWVLTSQPVAEGIHTLAKVEDVIRMDDIQYLYIEGGAQTAASFLAANLVDTIDIYRAPIIIGQGIAAIGDIGLASLDEAHGRWRLRDQRPLGADLYTTYERID